MCQSKDEGKGVPEQEEEPGGGDDCRDFSCTCKVHKSMGLLSYGSTPNFIAQMM